MILQRRYGEWSRYFHEKFACGPIVIQAELTYRCPLHCLHCYCGCYNLPTDKKKELSTGHWKIIIDKLYNAGNLWLCFTGGDPMKRQDFLQLYRYAKDRGFILTIFTSLVALNNEILREFKKKPPFSIETTLNAASKETYEKISRVEGTFEKAINNIKKILSAKIPLKIKTLLSRNNFHEKESLRRLVESLGCEFRPNAHIYPRLDGDTAPCQYRLKPEQIFGSKKDLQEQGCGKKKPKNQNFKNNGQPNRLFRCAAGNWQWHINPYGDLNICTLLRKPCYNLLKGDLIKGMEELSNYVTSAKFKTSSECRHCEFWKFCLSCPAQAKIETGHRELPVPYYCDLARLSNQ